MSNTAVFIYTPALANYTLREGHPMIPSRLQLTYELLHSYNAFDTSDSTLIEPRPATREEILTFHSVQYLEAVKHLSRGDAGYSPNHFGFSASGDNPIFPEMYEMAKLSTGGSVTGADLLLANKARVAFNPAGGLHHAMPDYASGFCIFNDPVIAINVFRKKGLKVIYVDIDAHHGDGVQHAFYNTKEVLTLSFHESGHYLFPGTGMVHEIGHGEGKGYNVNIPLYPSTNDELYLWAFQEIVPPLVSAFRPDILVTQLGVDAHSLDPLAHLNLSSHGYAELTQWFRSLELPWLALGGGGYDIETVARCWTIAYGKMVGRDWTREIHTNFQEFYGSLELHDDNPTCTQQGEQETARRFLAGIVAQIRNTIFPIHGL